jgi:hypothetical protein
MTSLTTPSGRRPMIRYAPALDTRRRLPRRPPAAQRPRARRRARLRGGHCPHVRWQQRARAWHSDLGFHDQLPLPRAARCIRNEPPLPRQLVIALRSAHWSMRGLCQVAEGRAYLVRGLARGQATRLSIGERPNGSPATPDACRPENARRRPKTPVSYRYQAPRSDIGSVAGSLAPGMLHLSRANGSKVGRTASVCGGAGERGLATKRVYR